MSVGDVTLKTFPFPVLVRRFLFVGPSDRSAAWAKTLMDNPARSLRDQTGRKALEFPLSPSCNLSEFINPLHLHAGRGLQVLRALRLESFRERVNQPIMGQK